MFVPPTTRCRPISPPASCQICTYRQTLNILFILNCSILKFIYQHQQVSRPETIKIVMFWLVVKQKIRKILQLQRCSHAFSVFTGKHTNGQAAIPTSVALGRRGKQTRWRAGSTDFCRNTFIEEIFHPTYETHRLHPPWDISCIIFFCHLPPRKERGSTQKEEWKERKKRAEREKRKEREGNWKWQEWTKQFISAAGTDRRTDHRLGHGVQPAGRGARVQTGVGGRGENWRQSLWEWRSDWLTKGLFPDASLHSHPLLCSPKGKNVTSLVSNFSN